MLTLQWPGHPSLPRSIWGFSTSTGVEAQETGTVGYLPRLKNSRGPRQCETSALESHVERLCYTSQLWLSAEMEIWSDLPGSTQPGLEHSPSVLREYCASLASRTRAPHVGLDRRHHCPWNTAFRTPQLLEHPAGQLPAAGGQETPVPPGQPFLPHAPRKNFVHFQHPGKEGTLLFSWKSFSSVCWSLRPFYLIIEN